jgi:hypothetical protein
MSVYDLSLVAIESWIQNPDTIVLSDKEKEILDRWDVADNLLRTTATEAVVVEKLCYKFKYSSSQARKDIKDAKYFFGSQRKIEKNYERHWAIERIKDAILKAELDRDYKSLAHLFREFRAYTGIDKDDAKTPKPYQATQHNYYITYNVDGVEKKIDVEHFHNLPEDDKIKVIQNIETKLSDEQALNILKS